MAEKTNTCSFGELLKTSCHKLNYTRSSGLKQLASFDKDTQTVYLWRAGLLEHHGENMTICFHHEQIFGNVFERSATKCCGILNNHRRKAQGLKKVTLHMAHQLKAKNFDVQPGLMLCRHCITIYENLISSSSPDTEETSMDDIDEVPLDDTTYKVHSTPKKRLNISLETIDVSPVKLHSVAQHSRSTKAKKKLDKVIDSYKNTIAEAYNVSMNVLDTSDSFFEDSDVQSKAAELERLHAAMREKLKIASYPEKIQILTLIPDKWSREYASKQFDVSVYLIRTARELKKVNGILAKPELKKGKILPQKTLDLVQSFYEDDEYSRQMPGKKEYVSIGRKVHKQKRLVLCNLSELYTSFKDKYPDVKIGFSKFCTLRPKWCVLAGPSGTHSVCVCSIHQNAVLLVDAVNWECSYKDLIEKVVCDSDNKICMMHRCESCPGSAALKEFLDHELSHLDMDSEFHYSQWQTTDRATLATLTTTFEEYKEILINSINNLTRHSYLAKAQARYVKSKKESLGANEVMVLGDFAENYQYLIQDEIQSYHWSKEYCTLYTLVIYYKDADGNLQLYSLCYISDDNTYDTSFVYKIQRLLVEFLKQRLPSVTKIYYVSDGCSGQYKNFKNFLNLCCHKEDFSIEAEWIFFATSHGKLPCDGIGGAVKRHAAKRSLQRPLNNLILNYRAMLEVCQEEMKSIIFFGVSKEDMLEVRAQMEKRFEEGKTVPGTRSSHHFIPLSASQIGHKLCNEDVSFADIHDFKIPTQVDIGDIAPSSYISCVYNSLWWVGLVNKVDEEQGDVYVQFMHPHGPRKTFNWPQAGDSCYIPIKNIVCAIQAPTTITGRTYKICDEDYNKTVDAFAKLNF